MLERFNDMSPVMRIVMVVILLIIVWTAVRIILGLLSALMPLVIFAAVIVAVLWLYEKIRDA